MGTSPSTTGPRHSWARIVNHTRFSVEVEKRADLHAPWIGYLVFPRWAETGIGIVGHVETPALWEGPARDEVEEMAGRTHLARVKELLDEAIHRRASEIE